MVKIYIDGQEGTTGLKILERFKDRNDIQLIRISEDKRKDSDERARLINSADFVLTLQLLTEQIRTGLTVSQSFHLNTGKKSENQTVLLFRVVMQADLLQ